MLDESLRLITECKRAKMTLTLGDEDVDFQWTEKEMCDLCKKLDVVIPLTDDVVSDKNLNENGQESNESNATIQPGSNTYPVFDADCKFTKRHKRTMITVMDKHRVSHKAYHAIRKAGKGNWPSLNLIKKEKSTMSKEIPFTTDDKVTLEKSNFFSIAHFFPDLIFRKTPFSKLSEIF